MTTASVAQDLSRFIGSGSNVRKEFYSAFHQPSMQTPDLDMIKR